MSLNGIDIASYQSSLVPSKMTDTDFIIIKATQGTTYKNPSFESHYSQAKAAGKLLGAYHYAAGGTPEKEAAYFIKTVGDRIGECILALDWEGNQNSQFGKTDTGWCKTFLDYVYEKTGVAPFIYMSSSVCRSHDWKGVAAKYPLWVAQYKNMNKTGWQSSPWDGGAYGAWSSPAIYQYSSRGRISGYSSDLDLDIAYLNADEWKTAGKGKITANSAAYDRKTIVSKAQSYVGIKEGSSTHHNIVDTYNAYGLSHGYPRGYKVKYTDSWCAVFCSVLAIQCGYTAIIPVECGCPQWITLAKDMGIWHEDDAYQPSIGDFILYDWQDSGSGDNTGTPDHIGIVESVSGQTITVIEGNYNDQVKRRKIQVNGKYIRGYVAPKYTTATSSKTTATSSKTTTTAKSEDYDMPLIKYGAKGTAVKIAQVILGGLTIDGAFGAKTLAAVKSFQSKKGLVVDGEIGEKTWAALFAIVK